MPMLSRTISRMLVVCGVLMMLFGASALPAQGAELDQAAAAPLLQPSPRPTLAPTCIPTLAAHERAAYKRLALDDLRRAAARSWRYVGVWAYAAYTGQGARLQRRTAARVGL